MFLCVFALTNRSISQAAGMADNRTPISINDTIHELSSGVMTIGVVSSSSSFGMDGDAQPLAVPADNSSSVAIHFGVQQKIGH